MPRVLNWTTCNREAMNGQLIKEFFSNNDTLLENSNFLCPNPLNESGLDDGYLFQGKNRNGYEVSLTIVLNKCRESYTVKKQFYPGIKCRTKAEIDEMLAKNTAYY